MMDLIHNFDEVKGFGIADYISFILMLLTCSAVGIYYGFFKGNLTVAEYTVGNRNMNVLPVSMSLIASMISSPLYIGKVTESYLYGLSVAWTLIASPIAVTFFLIFYLPTLHELKLSTMYEYLYLRFGSSIRIQSLLIFIIQQVFFCPIIIYVAALCFSEVTGAEKNLVAIVTSIICIIYTCVGGLRAVVWTDTIQTVMMLLSVIIMAIVGTNYAGGFQTVWEKNYNSSRIELIDTNIDFSTRYSLWSILFGFTLSLIMLNGLNQGIVQRCLCLPTLKDARRACVINTCGIAVFVSMLYYCGHMIHATYYLCDPISSHAIEKKDQIVPYFVMRTLKDVIGIRGLFIAGVFSAALSTLSTALNNLACVLLEDFYKPFLRKTALEKECKIFLMAAIVVTGSIFTTLTFVMEKLGTVYQVSLSLLSIINGPMLAIFTVGMYMPTVNNKAAMVGFWGGFFFVLWIFIGAQLTANNNTIGIKPLYTHGCGSNYTEAPRPVSDNESKYTFPLYKVSFFWYTTIGFLVSLFTSWILSFFTKNEDINHADMKLFSPLIRHRFPRREDPATEMKLIQ